MRKRNGGKGFIKILIGVIVALILVSIVASIGARVLRSSARKVDRAKDARDRKVHAMGADSVSDLFADSETTTKEKKETKKGTSK